MSRRQLQRRKLKHKLPNADNHMTSDFIFELECIMKLWRVVRFYAFWKDKPIIKKMKFNLKIW